MTHEKFQSEISTLKKFLELYCKNKHKNHINKKLSLDYKNMTFHIDLLLCEECLETINYSFQKLQKCPHEIKPRCRNCKETCYEKTKYIKLAKIMKYSGVKLGLSKAKQKLKSLFS